MTLHIGGLDAGTETRFQTKTRRRTRTKRNAAFAAFAEEVRRELVPRSLLESLLVDGIARAAWRLRSIEPDAPRSREESREERALMRAIDALENLRAGRRGNWGQASPAVEPETIDLSLADFDEIPVETPRGRPVSDDASLPAGSNDAEEDASEDSSLLWRDRLVFDSNVSEHSPVVKGTWVTVNHVVSLVIDGWTWSDILRTHPELTEDDIRACLTYTIEEERTGPMLYD